MFKCASSWIIVRKRCAESTSLSLPDTWTPHNQRLRWSFSRLRDEPSQRLTTKWSTSWQNQQNDCVPSAKTQIIRPVWSESSVCAQWVTKHTRFLHADSEDSGQTGRMPGLIWVFAGLTCPFVGFVMRRLKFCVTSPRWVVTMGKMFSFSFEHKMTKYYNKKQVL